MTRRQQYLNLAAWAESAEGPDRERDAELASALGWRRVQHNNVKHRVATWFPPGSNLARVTNFTSSLDALTAVIGEVLPGWGGTAEIGASIAEDEKGHEARLWPPGWPQGRGVKGSAPTPALALFAALCRALAEGCGDA